jgi:hypothetical protein
MLQLAGQTVAGVLMAAGQIRVDEGLKHRTEYSAFYMIVIH